MKFVVLLLLSLSAAVLSQNVSPSNKRRSSSGAEMPDECRSCNPENCVAAVGCLAGIVKDGCGCCDVCGKVEFELCDHPAVPRQPSGPYYGRCGDDLECRVRTDLDKDQGPEAICYCRMDDAICGSDNVTYSNLCQYKASALTKETKITIARKGPCNSGIYSTDSRDYFLGDNDRLIVIIKWSEIVQQKFLRDN